MISLTTKATKLIKSNGGEIYILPSRDLLCSTWGTGSGIPSVRWGKPKKDCDDYNSMYLNGVVVYVPTNFSYDKDLVIDAKTSSYGKEYIFIYALDGGKNV